MGLLNLIFGDSPQVLNPLLSIMDGLKRFESAEVKKKQP